MDDPGDVVVPCAPLHATLSLRACLRRHVAVWASGAARGSPLIPGCARCPIGTARLEAAPWFVAPKPTMPPVCMPPAQREARLRWALEHVDEPDDHGIGVDAG